MAIMTKQMAPVESDAKGFTVSDKLVHIFVFGVLVWLVLNWLRGWRGFLGKWAYGLTVGAVFLFAYGCEYLQNFIPTRTASPFDLIFGFVGMVLAAALFFYYKKTGKQDNKPKLLLHLCCGPCGAQISEDLKNNYEVSLFFANSNIDTPAEFNKRLRAAEILAKHNDLPLLVEPYDHKDWLEFIEGFESEPEKGCRCLLCYRYRLAKAALVASKEGFDWFASSLSVSPFKDGQAVLHLGKAEAADNGVKFLDQHFGLADGFKKSVNKAKELALYRQKYCGCEFSKGHLGKKK